MLQVLQDLNLHYGPFDDNTLLVTLDVVGLYTNLPHDDLRTTLHHFLDNGTASNSPPVEEFIRIMDHVLKNNVFEFDGELFQQVFGIAMAMPMAPSLANLFMAWLEEAMMAASPVVIPGEFGGGSWMTSFYSGQIQDVNWTTLSSTLTLSILLSNSL